jgi:hypothetical protein
MSQGSGLCRAILSVLVLLVAACAEDGAPPVASSSEPESPPVRPNIVLIIVDDLDFPSEAVLPHLGELLAERGVRFSRVFSTATICNPSRACLLTGFYTHNHGALQNSARQAQGGFPLPAGEPVPSLRLRVHRGDGGAPPTASRVSRRWLPHPVTIQTIPGRGWRRR